MTPGKPFDLSFARQLIQHAVWENRRLWQLAIQPLDTAQFCQVVAAADVSIRDECLRQMRQDRVLLLALGQPIDSPAPSGESDRSEIWRAWEAIGEAWRRVAENLEALAWYADCEATIDGEAVALKTWQIVMHFIYSGTACRARILRLVADAHQAPQFDLSLMQYITGVFRS